MNIHLDLYTHQSLKIPTLFQIHKCIYHHITHMLTNNTPTHPTYTHQPNLQNQSNNQSVWQTLTNYSENIHSLNQETIITLQHLLSKMLQQPQSLRPDLTNINERLNVLIQILRTQDHKIRSKTFQMLCLVLEGMPNCAMHYLLHHQCFWMLIDKGCKCKEQYQGYCYLMIMLFQHGQKITTETNMLKLIDLIPTSYLNVPHQLIILLCVRLVRAIEIQNQDKDGLCYRIYSHLRPYKTQLQLKHKINTTKLLNNTTQILQTILQDIYNHAQSNTHLALLQLLTKRQELSQQSLQSIRNNILYNFQLSDNNHKTTILRVLYALFESQFLSWYLTRDLTIEIVSLIVEYSIRAIHSRQVYLVGISFSKLYRYLHSLVGSRNGYKLKKIFYDTISKSQHINKLKQMEINQCLQISRAGRTLLQLIHQGNNHSQDTCDQLDHQNDHDWEIQLQLSEESQSFSESRSSESSYQGIYEHSESYFE